MMICVVVAAGCKTNNGSSAGNGRPTAAPTSAPPASSQSPVAPATPSVKPKSSAPPEPTGPGNYQTTGTVTRVVDGDTVEVTGQAGGVVTVRVLGIDSPETKDPRQPVQCWGPQATRFAQDTLNGKQVRLFTDPSQDVRDKYGRLLAYVILPDGSNYSVLAARAGAARSYVYSTPVSQHDEIAAAEKEAQNNGSGLWGPPCYGSTNAPQPTPTQTEPPPGAGGLDPRFNTCKEAIAHGYGPYYKGQDPEYDWYFDRDHDGIVCER
jgi:micrococcal nuclease